MLNPVFARYVRKALVGLCSFIALLVSNGLVPDPYRGYCLVGLSIAGVFGIYRATNAPSPVDETPAVSPPAVNPEPSADPAAPPYPGL